MLDSDARRRRHRYDQSHPPPESREIELVHPSYQPSEAELEEDVRIDATPEDLAQAVLRQ